MKQDVPCWKFVFGEIAKPKDLLQWNKYLSRLRTPSLVLFLLTGMDEDVKMVSSKTFPKMMEMYTLNGIMLLLLHRHNLQID